MKRRGMTIVELAFVLAVMGAVVAITVPTSTVLLQRARTDEARAFLSALEHAELRHFRDTGTWLACPASGEVPRGVARRTSGSGCWATLLGAEPLELRYRYRVDLVDGHFVAIAEGDLDGDGQLSEFRLDGRTHQLDIKDELE